MTLSRRHYLAASATLLAAAVTPRAAMAQTVIRQGYQTNLWGMPTYYLLRSGLLEKRGLKFEEFGVPSGNLTMQQMVARQVDMGTYAGPSLILGHDKGGLVAIAQIEHVEEVADRAVVVIAPDDRDVRLTHQVFDNAVDVRPAVAEVAGDDDLVGGEVADQA